MKETESTKKSARSKDEMKAPAKRQGKTQEVNPGKHAPERSRVNPKAK